MTLWVVVPVRPLAEGKSRLAPVLDADARRRLNERFLLSTLDLAKAVVGPARVLVVSRCADALALARAAGVATLRELGAGGLNAALRQGAVHLARRGATALMVLPVDLPLARPADLEALIRLSGRRPGVVIAGDRADTGTNALVVRPPRGIRFRFGPHSRAAHLREARRQGLRAVLVSRPALAFDVDTPADYAALESPRGAV